MSGAVARRISPVTAQAFTLRGVRSSEHLSPVECDRPARAAPRLAGVRKRSTLHSVERSVVGRQCCHRAGAGAGKTLASSIEAYLRRPGRKGLERTAGRISFYIIYICRRSCLDVYRIWVCPQRGGNSICNCLYNFECIDRVLSELVCNLV